MAMAALGQLWLAWCMVVLHWEKEPRTRSPVAHWHKIKRKKKTINISLYKCVCVREWGGAGAPCQQTGHMQLEQSRAAASVCVHISLMGAAATSTSVCSVCCTPLSMPSSLSMCVCVCDGERDARDAVVAKKCIAVSPLHPPSLYYFLHCRQCTLRASV